MHLGNARTFLVNWCLAKQRGWRILLRVDDLEGPRVKPGADREAIEDMQWLGLDWSQESPRQSKRAAVYESALRRLAAQGIIYPCVCTRSEIAANSIRAAEDGAVLYSGTCRGRFASIEAAEAETGQRACQRFHAVGEASFDDEFLGPQRFDATDLGDFVVRKSDGEFGYQLACVVDDAESGVTHVVRGHDLLASTPRQILVYHALKLSDHIPRYIHIPLVVGPDGRKLAKRHGDTRLRQLREEGVSAGQVRAMLARWSGFEPTGQECSTLEWVERFDLRHLPMTVVMYDDARQRPRS